MTIDVRNKLVDAHVHVHSPDIERYPLAPGFTRGDLWYPSMTPDDYTRYGRRYGKVRANLVQPTWYGLDHSYIIDCIASAPDQYVGTGVVPAVSDVALPPPDRAMLRLSERGIRAFRIRGRSARADFGMGARWMDSPGYDAMFETAARSRAGSELPDRPGRPAGDRPHVQPLSRYAGWSSTTWPASVFVTAGSPSSTSRPYAVSRDTGRSPSNWGRSTSLSEQEPPYLDLLPLLHRVIDAFGPERCMWETDVGGPVPMSEPVEDYAATVDLVLEHADFLSDGDREWVLYRTAESVFFWR